MPDLPSFDFASVSDAHTEAVALTSMIYAMQSLCGVSHAGSVNGDDLFILFNTLGQQSSRVVKAIEQDRAKA